MRAGIESSLYNFGEQVLIEDFHGLPGKPHQALLHQFPGAAVKGLVGHAQEGRQLFTRDASIPEENTRADPAFSRLAGLVSTLPIGRTTIGGSVGGGILWEHS